MRRLKVNSMTRTYQEQGRIVAYDQKRIGPIASIRDAITEERLIWFFCRWCGHASQSDPRDIARRAGRQVLFAELSRRLKCDECHRRGYAVVILGVRRFSERH
jgi:hypothetical protein